MTEAVPNAIREARWDVLGRTDGSAGGSRGVVPPRRRSTVRVERDGPVTTVTLDRPEVRNAVDGPTAAALAEAFARFDADDDAAVAVLTGGGGTFCAGADLTAVGGPDGNPTEPDGIGPMGPTRMTLSKPVIAPDRPASPGG